MNLLGVGPAEAGLVFVIALIVVGPQRFPEIMRTAGRWYRMARAYSNEVMKDVRSAVDDIEREVKAETEDLKSVREFADLGADLRAAQQDAEEIHRETRSVMRDEKPIRPSQRKNGTSNEAIPPIEAKDDTADDADVDTAASPAATASEVTPAPKPASKTEPEKPAAASFDPFQREKPKKGPKVLPRESVTSEGDDRL